MKNFLKLFLGVSGLHLLLLLFGLDNYAVFTKPLLLISLLMAVLSASAFKTKTLLLTALIFSWLGDVLLILTNRAELFFILGLVSFLISHVFYVVLFYKQASSKALNPKLFGLGIAITLVYLVTFLALILPYLGALKLPVVVYGLVISIMLAAAIRGALIWKPKANFLILFGAIWFVASDSLLAFNKFYNEFAFAGFLIMITYLAAQYFITRGLLRLNDAD